MTTALVSASAWIETSSWLCPAILDGGEHTDYTTVWWELCSLHMKYSWSIYSSCLVFPRYEHAHRMLLFWSTMWRKMVTTSGLLVSWWRWPRPSHAFPREPLANGQGEELWPVWIVLATCSQPPVLCDKTSPVRRGVREQLRARILSESGQLGLYELFCQAMDLNAFFCIIKFYFRIHLPCLPTTTICFNRNMGSIIFTSASGSCI